VVTVTGRGSDPWAGVIIAALIVMAIVLALWWVTALTPEPLR